VAVAVGGRSPTNHSDSSSFESVSPGSPFQSDNSRPTHPDSDSQGHAHDADPTVMGHIRGTFKDILPLPPILVVAAGTLAHW
jgi:hypothetical protein